MFFFFQAAKYTGLLLPLLGGSLPASAAVYHLLSSSSNLIKAIVLGMIVLGVLCVSSGLVAGTLGSSQRSLRYCRFATLSSFAILWLLLFFWDVFSLYRDALLVGVWSRGSYIDPFFCCYLDLLQVVDICSCI